MSEPPAVDAISNLGSMAVEEPKSPSLFSRSPPAENLSAYEPTPLNLISTEQKNTRVSTAWQFENIPAENNDTSLLKNDVQSDKPSSQDDGHYVKGNGDTLQTNPSLQRALSTVDPALLDPALYEQVAGDDAKPEKNPAAIGESVNPASPSNAELTAMCVIAAPMDMPKIDIASPSSSQKGKLGNTAEAISVDAEDDKHTSAAPTESVVRLPKPVKHNDPLEVRIASPITETTISGSSTTSKSPKGESKVSSWLKTKFSRRTSKPPKPEISDPIKSSSSNFIATGTAVTPNTSCKSQTGDTPLPRDVGIDETERSNLDDESRVGELHAANQPGKQREGSISSSVGSLSNGEGDRGRSDLRREETSSSRSDDFEEARDHFDTESLAPPAGLREFGRGSDSPVRDSKFQEDL